LSAVAIIAAELAARKSLRVGGMGLLDFGPDWFDRSGKAGVQDDQWLVSFNPCNVGHNERRHWLFEYSRKHPSGAKAPHSIGLFRHD
jgi:hypothetical protein